MGLGLRFREKVKQVGKKSSQPDKNGFIPTNYERVQLTYDEAVTFADSLKIIRRRIQESHTARTKMFKDVEKTLTGSLPRIHEIDAITGEHHTSEAAPEGQNADYVHTGTLTRLVDENDIKVETQVFNPIDKWISEVDLFKGKMKILENLRLELDGSRRDHITIENKIAKQEAKNNEADAKHTAHIQSKDASVAGKRTAFEQYEAQLYEELVGLIGETGVLHTALDRALKLEVEVLTRAADPIASTTARLEKLSSATGSGITSPVSSSVPYGTTQAGGYSQGASAPYGTTQAGGYGQGAQTGGYVPAGGHTGGYPQAPSVPSHGSVGVEYANAPSAPSGAAPSSTVGYERPYAS
jgi:hypothetical protein